MTTLILTNANTVAPPLTGFSTQLRLKFYLPLSVAIRSINTNSVNDIVR